MAAVNSHRARHHAPPLVENEELRRYAEAWAVREASGDELKHSHGPYGENLAKARNKWNNATEACLGAVTMWQDEEHAYDYTKPGFAKNTGHFTQQCWVASRRVGFGVAKIPAGKWAGGWLVVASYDPPGNYVDKFRENVLRPTASPAMTHNS